MCVWCTDTDREKERQTDSNKDRMIQTEREEKERKTDRKKEQRKTERLIIKRAFYSSINADIYLSCGNTPSYE